MRPESISLFRHDSAGCSVPHGSSSGHLSAPDTLFPKTAFVSRYAVVASERICHPLATIAKPIALLKTVRTLC